MSVVGILWSIAQFGFWISLLAHDKPDPEAPKNHRTMHVFVVYMICVLVTLLTACQISALLAPMV